MSAQSDCRICFGGAMRIEQISAVPFRVMDMRASVRFYGDVLGMEVLFGGEDASFSSLRAKYGGAPILNLEQGRAVPGWGRMIFYVADVDAFWEHLRGKDFSPKVREMRRGASDISTCQIRTVTSCRSRVRSSSLSTTAKTHPHRGEACEETCATLVDARFVRDGVRGMKQQPEYVPGS